MSGAYELEDIKAFRQIVRAGSLSRAAELYNIPKATLSHQLRRLEDALQVELFVRKAKGLELTDAGKQYLDHSTAIFESCENAASAAQRAHSTLGGRIRLVCSAEFGTAIMGAAVRYFSMAHPQINFEVQMYQSEKLIAAQLDFDCMIFVGEPSESSLGRRKMGDVSYGLDAAPSFIAANGMPDCIEAVNGLDGIVYARNGIPEKWVLRNGKQFVQLNPRAKFNVNEYWMAKFFTVEGAAMGYLPNFFVNFELGQKSLLPLFPEWRSKSVPIYVIYPAQRHCNPRIMKLVDALCSNFDLFIRNPGYALIKSDYGRNDPLIRN
jgi:DNA-binding transcriptional LysR family regulator